MNPGTMAEAMPAKVSLSCRHRLEGEDQRHQRGLGDSEPSYPWHAVYNASGQRRADWLLPGGVFVEAAGMVGEAGYDGRLADKRALAAANGIELTIITPRELADLAVIFAGFLCQGPPTG